MALTDWGFQVLREAIKNPLYKLDIKSVWENKAEIDPIISVPSVFEIKHQKYKTRAGTKFGPVYYIDHLSELYLSVEQKDKQIQSPCFYNVQTFVDGKPITLPRDVLVKLPDPLARLLRRHVWFCMTTED